MKSRTGDTPKHIMLKEIWVLAWPTMLEQFMSTAVQYIDTAMVGALGTAATAAVGATTTVNWLIGSSISALGVGFLAYISQAIGANEKERAVRAVAQSVFITVIVGTLFTVITLAISGVLPVWLQVDKGLRTLASSYFFILYLPMLPRTAIILFGTVLRSAGDSKTPMKIGLTVNIINVIGNLLLIFPERDVRIFSFVLHMWGAGWGVQGAAIASAIAFTAGGCLITVRLWRHPDISPRGENILPDKTILLPCLRIALPNMLQRFATSLGYVVFASMVNSLGEISMAAHTIANTVESAFYIPGYGMMAASATVTGNAVGANNSQKIAQQSRLIYQMEISLMVITGGLLFLFAEKMVGIFSNDRDVIQLGSTVLKMVALSEPFYGLSIVTEGMLQGAGKTKQAFFINVSGMWGIRIIGTYLGIHFWQGTLKMAWGFMIAHNLTVCCLFMLYYRYGRWNPLLNGEKR